MPHDERLSSSIPHNAFVCSAASKGAFIDRFVLPHLSSRVRHILARLDLERSRSDRISSSASMWEGRRCCAGRPVGHVTPSPLIRQVTFGSITAAYTSFSTQDGDHFRPRRRIMMYGAKLLTPGETICGNGQTPSLIDHCSRSTCLVLGMQYL
jgi:hypothetical protein